MTLKVRVGRRAAVVTICALLLSALAPMTGGPHTVEAQLAGVVRVDGVDHYAASVAVAREVGGGSLSGLTDLIIATGEQFPDAVVASGLAGFLDTCPRGDGEACGRTAVLLTASEHLPRSTADAIAASGVSASRIVVIGGNHAVSEAVRADIASRANWDGVGSNPVVRIAGETRYSTAVAVAEYITARTLAGGSGLGIGESFRTVVIATGEQSSDAVVASMLAYRGRHLVLLSPPDGSPVDLRNAIRVLNATCATIIGGLQAISADTQAGIDAALNSSCASDRVAGVDRYDTAVRVAQRFVSQHGAATRAVLASGVDPSGAWTAGPLSRTNTALLYATAEQLTPFTETWLTNRCAITNITLLGSPQQLPAQLASRAQQLATCPIPAPGPTTTAPTAPATYLAQAGGDGTDLGLDVAVLKDGSALITGSYSGTATFSATTSGSALTLNSVGDRNIYVAKVNSAGLWEWAISAGGTGIDEGHSISALTNGSAIITGYFNATATFSATTSGSAITLTSSGNTDVFVAKVSSTGLWEWAVSAGGTGPDVGESVAAVHSDGSAIITGSFRDTATFLATTSGSALTLISSGNTDVFVAKVSSTGLWEWAVSAGGTSFDAGQGVAVHADGSAIVTGYFGLTTTFSPTTSNSAITLACAGAGDVFVAKITADGLWEWATPACGSGSDIGRGVAVHSDGSAIITGYFMDEATFSATTLNATFSEGRKLFVAKVTASGQWEWAIQAGGNGDDRGEGVALLNNGSAIITGHFGGATFSPTTSNSAITFTSAGGDDVFVAKVTPNGLWEWVTQAGGSGEDRGGGVAVLHDDSVLIAGRFAATATFGTQTLIGTGTNNSSDIFLAKITADGRFG